MIHNKIDLCGLWRFQPDPSNEGEKAGYYNPDYDFSLWREIRLPCDFDSCSPYLESYEGTAWYMRKVNMPADWKNKRVLIQFQGANYHTKVWFNGKELGENLDGFLPFSFPIQDLAKFGDQNFIIAKVDNYRNQGDVPGIQRGWRTYGGILREVELISTEKAYINNIVITAEPLGDNGKFLLKCDIANEFGYDIISEIVVEITDNEDRTVAKFLSDKKNVGTDLEFLIEEKIDNIQTWTPKNPKLYKAKIQLYADEKMIDEKIIRFGFRKIQSVNGKLLLNDKPIYLTGFNRHEDCPKTNMVFDLEIASKDLQDMKSAGANFVRLCHYPHHPKELDLCDEIGLLVMGEIPLYWWDGYNEGEENCQKKLETAKRQLKKMIERDMNHPSIIFWSVSNENQEERPEVAEGNRELVRFAKKLDPTRLAVHVSDHWQKYPNFSEDDVICVNAYPSFNKRVSEGKISYNFSESTKFWREGLQKLHEQYPNKPILITEFGYPSFEGVNNNGLGEDSQSLAIEKEFEGMSAYYVCGATIWCWADHPWPPTVFSFCNNLGISPFGVVSRERRRLRAYWVARSIFKEKHGYKETIRIPSRDITPAGDNVTMIRDNMKNILEIPFPDGFSIRPMKLDDGSLWTDIERDAEIYFPITDDIFYNEFGRDLQATQWRGFIITNDKGVGVGTITAWYNRRFKGKDYGQIHWVAIRPAYQGKGLGKSALSYALNLLAQWHERCFLQTQTKRLNAIKLYLDFGFVPDMDIPYAEEIWREVKINLRHPALERLPI